MSQCIVVHLPCHSVIDLSELMWTVVVVITVTCQHGNWTEITNYWFQVGQQSTARKEQHSTTSDLRSHFQKCQEN